MGVLSAVRVKNLRCFDDTGYVEIRPVTLFVGRNSAGKSTFARLFPLLRQSVEEEKRSPILWYGRLVDFGNFGTVLNRNASDKSIEFSFRLKISENASSAERSRFLYYRQPDESLLIGQDGDVTVTLRVEQKDKGKPCYASYIHIEIFGNICELTFADEQTLSEICVNGEEKIVFANQNYVARLSQQRIFPSVTYFRQFSKKTEKGEQKFFLPHAPIRPLLREALYSAAANRNMQQETVDTILHGIPLGSDEVMLSSMAKAPTATPPFRKKAAQLSKRDIEFRRLRNLIYLQAIPTLLSELDTRISAVVSGVKYIEPLRATAQRYYRVQELAVDELDSKGGNVAMFIDSLTDSEKSRLNTWLRTHFGVSIRANNEGGHVALELQMTNSGAGVNLADLGFGFSQLLPIVLQLWHSSQSRLFRSRRGRSVESNIVVIEQPELHLHPAYQAQIADVMVAALADARAQGRDLNIVAETHSPHLVNRLGELVEANKLSANDVQVVLFEDGGGDGCTQVNPTYFDEDGVLVDWPFGFFEP